MAFTEPLHGLSFALLHLAAMAVIARTVPPAFAASAQSVYSAIGVGAAATGGFFGMSGNNDLDEGTLKAIAEATGGKYFRATDARALQAVYSEIDRLEPVAGHEQWLRPTDEWFPYPLAAALLLSLPAVWFGARAWT